MVRGSLLVGAVALLALAPTAAGAQDDYIREPVAVQGVEIARPASAPVVLSQEADPDDDRIPITGGDVVGLTVMGLASVAVGTALTRRARRHV